MKQTDLGLCIHLMQQRLGLSDVAMEDAAYDPLLCREFAGLAGMSRLPDRISSLRFRHLLQKHQLAERCLRAVNRPAQCLKPGSGAQR
ncbi:transposase [Ralstonia solanacearum]|nr:transposase [Ralstonia solanacearum]